MKIYHLILAGALAGAAGCESTSTMSGDTSTSQAAIVVSPVAQSEFTLRYPNATTVEWAYFDDVAVPIDWEMTGWPALGSDDYVVTYEMNGDRYMSWYDDRGTWVATTYTLRDHNGLPAAVRNTLSEKYAGHNIDEVDIEMWGDRTAYEVELENSTQKTKLLIDANGTIIKEKVKVK